jgi:acetyl esterase/lipase
MTVPVIFLIVSLVGVAFTWNAHRPTRRLAALMVPSFLGGWLTSELPLHHLAWQVVATIGFGAAGAFEAWPGWLGLAICFASWAGLLGLVGSAQRAHDVVREALSETFGDEEASPLEARPRIALNPFAFKHPDVEHLTDIRYAEGAGRRHLLDIRKHKAVSEGAPVLLQIHGGAWIIGEKREQGVPLMTELATRGWVCVAINYRLSPRATWPEHVIDCKRALAWIRDHIHEYGGDPGFVAATGGSAGGHLSSLVALTPGDPIYQPGFEEADTSVAACVPFYGVYDWSEEFVMPGLPTPLPVLERTVVKQPLSAARDLYRAASPSHRVHPDAPPFFVVHGSHDSLANVEGARLFVDRLREVSKSPVGYAEIPGAQHAFEIFHSLRTGHVVSGVGGFLDRIHADYRAQQGAAAASGSRSG